MPNSLTRGVNPFTLGVASGDPTPDGVVIWTRLAPDPLCADPARPGGLDAKPIEVHWQVAADERFAKVVRHGRTTAVQAYAHSVHVEVTGLEPGREHFYRFKAGSAISPVGRTRTAPAPAAAVPVRFAYAACQMYEHGYFTAYRHMAEERPDLILFLGDYIYEYGPHKYLPPGGSPRKHDGPEIKTRHAYRNRHALYRLDRDLQAAHAAAPWLVTWDDHDVRNNYAGPYPPGELPADPERRKKALRDFAARRAAAYQAFYEHMPLRAASIPRKDAMRLYRHVPYGALAEFDVLDTRQHRSRQAAGGAIAPPNPEQADPKRTMLGAEQERWLAERLSTSPARWRFLAQAVFFARRAIRGAAVPRFSMDAWDGYPPARDRLMEAIRRAQDPAGVVFLTGDVHAAWAAEVRSDLADAASAPLATEFVCTSITSEGDGSDTRPDTKGALADNPHIRFFNNYRGYTSCLAAADALRVDYRVVPYVSKPGAPVHTRAAFLVEAGNPVIHKILDRPLPLPLAGLAGEAFPSEDSRVAAQEV
ncbi:alkaline phosphatase D family protein [Bailinhaonella thermotolerans]|nr:alkaline phosphatase D family protein [Bailinhaonella thermotolerans]